MKKMMEVAATLVVCASLSNASCLGRLKSAGDLSARPGVVRDVADGRWDAATTLDVWGMACNGKEWLDIGPFTAWDASHGLNYSGLHVSAKITSLQGILGGFSGILGLPSIWIPARLASNYVGIGAFGAYRPKFADPDLRHHWPYGFLIELSIPFGPKDVASGL